METGWDLGLCIDIHNGGGGLDFHLTLYSSKNLQGISGGFHCILIS
jgi:hypothetical protein